MDEKEKLINEIDTYLILLEKENKKDVKYIYSELMLMKSFLKMPGHFRKIIKDNVDFSLDEQILMNKINELIQKLNKIYN